METMRLKVLELVGQHPELPLCDIGAACGLSRQRVHQILKAQGPQWVAMRKDASSRRRKRLADRTCRMCGASMLSVPARMQYCTTCRKARQYARVVNWRLQHPGAPCRYNRRHYAKQKALGKCPGCGLVPEAGVYCRACRARINQYYHRHDHS